MERTVLRKIILTLLVVILLVSVLPITLANPMPPPEPPPAEISGGGPVFNGTCNIRFVSENVTIFVEDYEAQIYANYTFLNKENHSTGQQILLPFYQKPYGISIKVKGNDLDYKWTKYLMNVTKKGYMEFRLYYNAIQFNLNFQPLERITIEVEYDRSYCYHNYYKGDIYNNLIYLTRTGALWDDPIEYANFEFYVNKEICAGRFIDNSSYVEFSMSAYDNNESYYGLYAVAHLTEFLRFTQGSNDSYYHFKNEYYNWTPEKDIGVAWKIEPPVVSMELTYLHSKDEVTVQMDGSGSYDPDGEIKSVYWSMGDGNSSNDIITNHTYTVPGKYQISLRATDKMGCSSSESQLIYIYSYPDKIIFNVSKLTGIFIDEFNMYPENYCKWNFNNGPSFEGVELVKTNTNPGVYNLKMEYQVYGNTVEEDYKIIILEFDTDSDGIYDSSDAFPRDPAASVDTDRDGYPDSWNLNMTINDSTLGLKLDSDPLDPKVWDNENVHVNEVDDNGLAGVFVFFFMVLSIAVFVIIIILIAKLELKGKKGE